MARRTSVARRISRTSSNNLAAAKSGVDERASAIREAREAALVDEGGKDLDAALIRHGAPPRPVAVKPMVFVPRKAAPSPRTGTAA